MKNEEDMKRTQEKLVALTQEQEEMETDAAKVCKDILEYILLGTLD